MAIKTDAYYASCTYDSPVGMLTLAASEEGLKGLWPNGQKYFAGTLDRPMLEGASEHLEWATRWLDAYFAGEPPAIAALSLAPNGSGFQQAVWKLLCDIPSGEVRAYGELAKDVAMHLGKESMSAQAVGGAVGRNPISIIVPCHRVVGSHGSLTGYAGGINRKLWLLEHEGVDCSGFHIPAHSTAP